jgi:hypothetical protein
MKKLLVTAALAAALAAPAPALAAETAYVASGTLTYTSELGQADAVTVGDGNGSYAGRHYLTESMSPSGTSGAGCTPLSGYPTVVCDGVTRFDVATLDQNDLVSVLSALPTRIDAGDGDDFVTGGAGPDTVDGGAGADDIATGGGDDRIAARDGSVDTIDCGAGDDRADADAFDVVKNCETDPVPVTGEAATASPRSSSAAPPPRWQAARGTCSSTPPGRARRSATARPRARRGARRRSGRRPPAAAASAAAPSRSPPARSRASASS